MVAPDGDVEKPCRPTIEEATTAALCAVVLDGAVGDAQAACVMNATIAIALYHAICNDQIFFVKEAPFRAILDGDPRQGSLKITQAAIRQMERCPYTSAIPNSDLSSGPNEVQGLGNHH